MKRGGELKLSSVFDYHVDQGKAGQSDDQIILGVEDRAVQGMKDE